MQHVVATPRSVFILRDAYHPSVAHSLCHGGTIIRGMMHHIHRMVHHMSGDTHDVHHYHPPSVMSSAPKDHLTVSHPHTMI